MRVMKVLNTGQKMIMLCIHNFTVIAWLTLGLASASWAGDGDKLGEENDFILTENTTDEAGLYEHEVINENDNAIGDNDDYNSTEFYHDDSSSDSLYNSFGNEGMENDDTGDFYEPEMPDSHTQEESI